MAAVKDDFTFVERGVGERGFAQVYDEKIAPFLRAQEVERQAAARRSTFWVWIVLLIAAVLAVLALRLDPLLPIFPVAFGAGIALLIYLSRGGGVNAEVTAFIRPVICDFYDDMAFSETYPEGAFPAGTLRDLGVIPKADRSSTGPCISGDWRGVAYTLTKASFSDEYRDSDGKVKRNSLFGGIVVEIECLEDMPTVVFYPDLGETLNTVMNWVTRVSRPAHRFDFPDTAVEEVFEVYTDDPQEARRLMHPEFGAKLLQFARDYQASKTYVAAAFQGRRFYLAIDLPHEFMGFDVAGQPLSDCNGKIHRAIDDLMIPRRIIDILLD